MQMNLLDNNKDPFERISVEPLREIAAYEALWQTGAANFKKIAQLFSENPGKKPSDLVSEDVIQSFLSIMKEVLNSQDSENKANVLINETYDYPSRLRDAQDPVEMLYYKGDLDLINSRSVAVVGTRKPSVEGLARTSKLVKCLIKDGFTIVSGLAEGIDTKAHETAIENEGKTIAVIGTPLNECYPKKNKALQNLIAKNYLLISQIPFWIYGQRNYRTNRLFFPERNKTMSALTEATVIIEAGETSGTLIQAKAALYQKRKLFILESCFQNKNITWPEKFEKQGAIRVRDYDDIRGALESHAPETAEN